MENNIWIYLAVAFTVIYLIRVLPMTLIRKDIKNKFFRSFLYYVPYVTLSVMTFPAILFATGNYISAWAGFIVGLLMSWFDGNLFRVAVFSCLAVFISELIMMYL